MTSSESSFSASLNPDPHYYDFRLDPEETDEDPKQSKKDKDMGHAVERRQLGFFSVPAFLLLPWTWTNSIQLINSQPCIHMCADFF